VTASPRPGSLRASFERMRAAGIAPDELVATVGAIQVTPVITAHPTEVRRKTILEVLDQIGDLLVQRSELAPHDDRQLVVDDELATWVLLLWQTALLRLSKLRVRDEIKAFIETIPKALDYEE